MPSPLYDPNIRPDLNFVTTGLEHFKTKVWGTAWTKWKEIDSYIAQEYNIWDANLKRPQTRTSTAAARVLHALNNLMASNPKVHCEPAGEGKQHGDRAEDKENGLSAVLVDASKREALPVFRTIAFNFVRYDYAVYHAPLLEPNMPAPKPRKRRTEDPEDFKLRMEAWEAAGDMYNPIRIRAPHPSTVLLDPMSKDPLFGFMVTQRPGWKIAEITRRKAETRDGVTLFETLTAYKDFEDFELKEFWTPYYHWVGLEGKELYVEDNGTGIMPFKHSWGGRGGEFTGDNGIRTDHLGIGLITPILDDLLRESQQLSAIHNLLVEGAWPKVEVPNTTDTADAAQAFQHDFVPAGFKYLDPPKMIAGIQDLITQTARQIEQGTIPISLGGYNTGVPTLGQEALLSDSGLRALEQPRLSMEAMTSAVAEDILRVVDYRGEPIKLRGAELRPKDIEKLYQADVTFPVVDKVGQLQERELGMQEVEKKLQSKKMYLMRKGVENLHEEMDEIDLDTARENPIFTTTISADAYRKMGMDQLADKYYQMADDLLQKQRMDLGLDQAVPAGAQASPRAQQGMEDLAAGSEIQPGNAVSLRRANPGGPQAAAIANGQMSKAGIPER